MNNVFCSRCGNAHDSRIACQGSAVPDEKPGIVLDVVDFVYIVTQLDTLSTLLRKDNFRDSSRPSIEKMVKSLRTELEKYVKHIT